MNDVLTVDELAAMPLAVDDHASPSDGRHLERSSMSLVVNTAATGGLGAAFWLVAARLYPPDQIGAAVAASSLLIALAFGAQLNLATALSRHLPGAGAQQRSMVRFAYLAGTAAALVVGVSVALVALARDGVIVDGLSPGLLLALVLSLPVWVVFSLQDSVLIAVRRSEWVPIENAVASVAKLAVLPIFVGVGGGAGVLLAWTVPAVPLVLVVSTVLLRRFLAPGHEPFTARRAFVGYAVRDLPGSILYLLSLRLVPLLVLQQLGAEQGAYIGVPWTIVTVAALVLPAMSRSLLVELAHGDIDHGVLLGRAVRLVLVVLAPCALVGFVAAGPLLALAGASYEASGQLVLAWGLLGLVPAALVECQLALLRYEDRVGAGAVAQGLRAAALLTAVAVLIAGGHSEYIGVAFLVVGVLAAAGLGVVVARPSRAAVLRALPFVLPVAAGIPVAVVAIQQSDADRIGRLGLIQAVSPLYYVAVGLVLLGLFLGMGAKRRAPVLTVLHVGVLIVLLHGLPAMIETNPRFPIAWLHAGFVDQLAANGKLLPALDARFSWAGFFAGNALIEQAGGAGAPFWLLRFTPVAVNAAACWAIWVLSKPFGLTQRQRLCALPVFVLANWVGQDYFSPQATNLVLFLIVIAVVVNAFGQAPGGFAGARAGRLAGLLRSGPVERLDLTVRQQVLTLLGLVVIVAAVVVSHQLTPFFLAAALILMGLVRATKLRWLGWATVVGTVAWIAFSAEAYWVGHWSKLIGSTGEVNTLVQRNLADRTAAGDVSRAVVVDSRLLMAGLVWFVAGLALVLAWRRRRTPVAIACLLVAPFPIFALQSYGGEMLLRVYLFALPAAAILIGTVLAPSGRDLRLRRRLVLAAVATALVPLFVVARYGNERFEQVSGDDLAVVEALYAQAPAGSVVYVLNPQTIVYSERVDQVRFAELRTADTAGAALDEVVARGRSHPSWVLVTESQLAYEEQVHARPTEWAAAFRSEVTDPGRAPARFDVVATSGDAVLLRLHAVAPEEGS